MALDSILSAPIIPAPPKSATPTAAAASAHSGANGAAAAQSQSAPRASSDDDSSSTQGGSTNPPSNSSSNSSDVTQSSGKRSLQSGGKPGATAAKTNSSAGPQLKLNVMQAQANGAASAKSTADASQPVNTGPSFLAALAQSQADAANTTAAANPQKSVSTGGKPKAAAGQNTSEPPSFAFISQSLAPVMVGVQTPAQSQSISRTSTPTDDKSTQVISTTSGSVGPATIADLTSGVDLASKADLKTATDATDSLKSDPPTTPAPVVDRSNPATTAFQAQMSVSSHFQHPGAAQVPASKVDAPVGTAAFHDELGGKITWMASQGMQSASLQLSPEHLGPVDVRISVQDGSATVSFNAMHADTRAALEQALPRLREMFATHGLTLTDASVSQQSPRGQAQKQPVVAVNSVGRVSDEPNSAGPTSVASVRLGLVDTYA